MARPQLSQEFVEDSASERQSEDSEAGSEDDSNQLKNVGVSKVPSSNSTTSSGSESDSTSGSDSQAKTSTVNGSKRKLQPQQQISPGPNKRLKSNPAHIPSRSYQPPQGYLPVKLDSEHGNMAHARSKSVQIWHITAPASVPLSKVRSFDIQAALRGEPILEYKGISYNMQTMQNYDETLLIPSEQLVSTGNGSEVTTAYQAVTNPITKRFSLQATTSVKSAPQPAMRNKGPANMLSPSSSQSEASSNDLGNQKIDFYAKATGERPPPRQQPKNLLMRYHPYGSGRTGRERMANPDSEAATDQVEEADQDPESSKPLQNGFTAPPSTQSEDEMEVDSLPDSTRRSKKSNKPKKHDHDGQDKVDARKRERQIEKRSRVEKKVNGSNDTMDIDHDDIAKDASVGNDRKKEKRKRKDKKGN